MSNRPWLSQLAPNMGRLCVALLPVAVVTVAFAQTAAPPDPFEPIAFLVGRWEGTSEGQPGKGTLRLGG